MARLAHSFACPLALRARPATWAFLVYSSLVAQSDMVRTSANGDGSPASVWRGMGPRGWTPMTSQRSAFTPPSPWARGRILPRPAPMRSPTFGADAFATPVRVVPKLPPHPSTALRPPQLQDRPVRRAGPGMMELRGTSMASSLRSSFRPSSAPGNSAFKPPWGGMGVPRHSTTFGARPTAVASGLQAGDEVERILDEISADIGDPTTASSSSHGLGAIRNRGL